MRDHPAVEDLDLKLALYPRYEPFITSNDHCIAGGHQNSGQQDDSTTIFIEAIGKEWSPFTQIS